MGGHRLCSDLLTLSIDRGTIHPRQALSRHEASGAEQKRLVEGKDHEVKRLTELLARTNKVRFPCPFERAGSLLGPCPDSTHLLTL